MKKTIPKEKNKPKPKTKLSGFYCDKCKKEFTSKSYLISHYCSKKTKDKYKCLNCKVVWEDNPIETLTECPYCCSKDLIVEK